MFKNLQTQNEVASIITDLQQGKIAKAAYKTAVLLILEDRHPHGQDLYRIFTTLTAELDRLPMREQQLFKTVLKEEWK